MLRQLRARIPEALALLLGVLLRISMAITHDARTGFDFNCHWPYINYVASHHALAPLTLCAVSYHPPLYHVLAAALVNLGLGPGALAWFSVLLGILQLIVVWIGLERWLPESRLARVVALFTAAVLPASVQLDGMITNEPLNTLICALALVAAPAAIQGLREGRIAPTARLAVWLGIALITKISGTVLVVGLLIAIVVDVARGPQPWREAWRIRWKPLAVGASLLFALSGWFFIRNQALYGLFAPTGYDGTLKINQEPYEKIPYLQRRHLSFFLGWSPAVFVYPYAPSGYVPEPHFFPVMVASTFSDFYLYDFPARDAHTPTVGPHRRPIPRLAFYLSCLSTIGGTVLAALAFAAWIGSLRAMKRRPADPRLVLLLLPPLAILGQMHFSTKYPDDDFGTIKGTYVQFVAPILCGLFGLAVAWMWRRARARAGAVVALAALGLVALYTIDCRLPRFGPGASGAAPFLAAGKR